MTSVALIRGTWSGAWAEPCSPFSQLLVQEHILPANPPFEWSGDVSGVPNLFAATKHSDWTAGGFALNEYLRGRPYEHRNIIAHSHGASLVAYAASQYECWIRRLITVGTPSRQDMQDTWEAAVGNIGYWLHVADEETDWMARLGQLFDGRFGWLTGQPWADENVLLPDIGHSGILTNPAKIDLWKSEALLHVLTNPEMKARHRPKKVADNESVRGGPASLTASAFVGAGRSSVRAR